MYTRPAYLLGIDIGGTFTDVIALNIHTGETRSAKAPTTPGHFVGGILDSVDALGISLTDVSHIVHGSTTCTNALIEHKNALTGFLGTQGFSDEFDIQRMIRRWSKTSWSAIYDLHQKKPAPFVPRYLRRELDERIAYPGVVVKELDEEEVRREGRQLVQSGASAIAVCLLWATANSRHESRVKTILREEFADVPISISSEVAPVVREYERMVTTAVNASLMPIMSEYLGNVEQELRSLGFRGSLLLMQSHGGVAEPHVLRDRPIFTLRGGPVAGVVAANHLGKQLGKSRLISCDIGGTSCDTAVVLDNTIPVTDETEVDYYPVKIPTVDIRCIGAGGGSIAYVDSGGTLRVGPESAGASPGPACYGRGTLPTLTDANLILGRLSSDEFCGGRVRLRVEAAEAALKPLEKHLACDVAKVAHGIVCIAVATMAESIRLQTIDRGHDPREFALVAFGGGGPLHASLLAEACAIPEVIIPLQPGVFSSVGMVVAEMGYYTECAYLKPLAEVDPSELEARLQQMEASGAAMLKSAARDGNHVRFVRSGAMRYTLQEWEIRVPIAPGVICRAALDGIVASFHAAHHARYGFAREHKPVEFVALYVDSIVPAPRVSGAAPREGDGDPAGALKGIRQVYVDDQFVETPIYDRSGLEAGDTFHGPCVIEELTSTTFVQGNWRGIVDPSGNLMLRPTGVRSNNV
jgi:N-methylhydantoinase A